MKFAKWLDLQRWRGRSANPEATGGEGARYEGLKLRQQPRSISVKHQGLQQAGSAYMHEPVPMERTKEAALEGHQSKGWDKNINKSMHKMLRCHRAGEIEPAAGGAHVPRERIRKTSQKGIWAKH
jgi:hypothetical protein